MDRGNSLPCVLEQKVRGSGGAAGGEARGVNALRGPPGDDGGQQGSWGRRTAKWHEPLWPLQADKGA